ncbi:MAG TPA: hypothetical protein VEA41_10475 [Salinarimonas sp.]|nr:hypothetical protein [Salinarimonas sp.]
MTVHSGSIDRGWLKAQVAALFALFPPPPQQTPETYAARMLAYVEDLAEYPQELVAEAIREARRGAQTFCPSIKDIRSIADRLRRERRPPTPYAPPELPPPPPGGYCTPEQAAEVLKHMNLRRVPGDMTQTEFERKRAKMLEEIDQWMRERGHDWPPPYDAPLSTPSRNKEQAG